MDINSVNLENGEGESELGLFEVIHRFDNETILCFFDPVEMFYPDFDLIYAIFLDIIFTYNDAQCVFKRVAGLKFSAHYCDLLKKGSVSKSDSFIIQDGDSFYLFCPLTGNKLEFDMNIFNNNPGLRFLIVLGQI